jgi:hypothetical protein
MGDLLGEQTTNQIAKPLKKGGKISPVVEQ